MFNNAILTAAIVVIFKAFVNLSQSAHAVLELQDQGKPVYKAKSVSFSSLCDMYGASPNPLKDQASGGVSKTAVFDFL